MRRFWIRTNGYNMVAFVDDEDMACVFTDDAYDTFEDAINHDYEGLEGCETAEDCCYAIGGSYEERVFPMYEVVKFADIFVEF